MKARSVWGRMDFLVLFIVAGLAVLSLVVLFIATKPIYPLEPTYYDKRQAIWMVLGLLCVLVVAAIPYERIAQWSKYIYWGNMLLLMVVLVKGHTALGASRWIGFGNIQVQPSEFAKVAIIVTLADLLSRRPSMRRIRDWVSPVAHVLLPMVLIIKQPDLGTALVFVVILLGMLYAAGAPGPKLLLVFGGGFGLVVLWIYAHLHWTIGHHPIPIFMHTYQLNRLLIFLNPGKSPMGSGYNIIQSRIAVGIGGVWGVGVAGSHAGQLSFLPEATTDFVFAVVAQVLGFVGTIGVLLAYFIVLARGLVIAAGAKDRLGMLMAAGVVAMLGFHVIENAGMAIGVMPVAGVPLPFVSYGGSAFIADSLVIGLLMSVYARRDRYMFVAEPAPATSPAVPAARNKPRAPAAYD